MLFPFITGTFFGLSYVTSSGNTSLSKRIIVSIAILVALAIGIIKISTTEKYLMKISSIIARLFGKNKGEIEKWMRSYLNRFKKLREDRLLLVRALTVAYLAWAIDMTPLFLVFKALRHPIPVGFGLFIYSLNVIIALMPIGIPGSLGVREGTMAFLLVTYGFNPEIAVTATILASTLAIFINQLIVGAIVYAYIMGREIRKL